METVDNLNRAVCYLLLLKESLKPWQGEIEQADQRNVGGLRKCHATLDHLGKDQDREKITQVQANISVAKGSNKSRNFVQEKTDLNWAMFDKMMANADHLLYGDDRNYLIFENRAAPINIELLEEECHQALKEVRHSEKTMLQRALPARKFTPCTAFKAGRCSAEYCILDHDFGNKVCRDNAYPDMLCVIKDCHFKHSNDSWTPANGGAPSNLTEILENLDQKSKWKNFCRDVNTTGGCGWGSNCWFSHALDTVHCPDFTATGVCPRGDC